MNTATTANAVANAAKKSASGQRRRNACISPDIVGVLVKARGKCGPFSAVAFTSGGKSKLARLSGLDSSGVDGNAIGVFVDSEGMAISKIGSDGTMAAGVGVIVAVSS